jgi:hypothetical protein
MRLTGIHTHEEILVLVVTPGSLVLKDSPTIREEHNSPTSRAFCPRFGREKSPVHQSTGKDNIASR